MMNSGQGSSANAATCCGSSSGGIGSHPPTCGFELDALWSRLKNGCSAARRHAPTDMLSRIRRCSGFRGWTESSCQAAARVSSDVRADVGLATRAQLCSAV